MYTENPPKDIIRFVKACLSNQMARFAPKLYITITHETGRGEKDEDALHLADYYLRCFQDYHDQIGLSGPEFRDFLRGRTVLEYGPGDILGVALLMYAYGAESVQCVDRFPLENTSEKNVRVYNAILAMLSSKESLRASHAFNAPGRPETGFNQRIINYSVTEDGLSGAQHTYDLVISRAVLEHVNNLELTISDMARALKEGGTAVHNVDLRSHGLDRYTALDFLTWPEIAYRLMHSYKGYPNRWRVNKYREIIQNTGLHLKNLTPTDHLDIEEIERIRPKLARQFRALPSADLQTLGFWMVLERPRKSSQ